MKFFFKISVFNYIKSPKKTLFFGAFDFFFKLQNSNFKLQTSNFKLQTSNFKLHTCAFGAALVAHIRDHAADGECLF
jgi:hypothetical protein